MTAQKADPKAMAYDFVVNGMSQAEIARKYGLTPATVSERARRDDWKGQKLAHLNSITQRSYEKVAESVANDRVQHINEAIAVARGTLMQYAKQLKEGNVHVTPKDAELMARFLVITLNPEGIPATDDSAPRLDANPDSTEFLRRMVEDARGRLDSARVLEAGVLVGSPGAKPN